MIKANFNTYASYVTDSLYQWDLNQVLSVSGLNLAVVPEVHFSNANTDRAIVRQATMTNHVVSVAIPNSLLQDPLTIHAHIGIYEGDTFKIVERVDIPVIPKKRPSDYRIETTDEEIYSFQALENAIANMVTHAEANVINARIDMIVANANKTDGNSELMDIRVGANGKTYDSAGAAVRSQLDHLENNLIAEINALHNIEQIMTPALYSGFVRCTNGELSNDSMGGFYKRTEYILIPLFCKSITHNFKFSAGGNDGYSFFDKAYKFISGGRNATVIDDIPSNARYFMITNYDDTFSHKNKFVNIISKNVTSKNTVGKLVTFGDSHVERGLWQSTVAKYFNVTDHVNLGIGSSAVAVNENATKLPFIDDTRISEIKAENPDTLIIIGGTNDVHLDTPLGNSAELSKNIDDKNKTNFYGAYSYLIETLLNWKPTLKIIVCTTPQGYYDISHTLKYSDVSKAIVEIAAYYSLPVADIFSKCGINKINLATYSDDLIHYNVAGNARVSALIIETINNSYF